MKKIIIKYFLLILILKSGIGYSQTIDYSYKQLDTPACNTFAHARAVDGFTHRTSFNRPVYSDNSIKLECKKNNSSSVFSTQYSINYNFKVGYNYKISVYYLGTKSTSDGYYPSIGLKISTTNGGIDSGVNCTSTSTFQISNIADFTLAPSPSNYNWATNLIDVTMTQNANYLLVGAFPWTGTSNNGYVFVRKIQITETAPAPVTPVFNISPSTVNTSCGTAITQTFTVNNVNNTVGVSYEWNLGSANNGWLYQGSAAPQTIQTTTGNSITLTAASGCTVPSNVIGIAKVGGTNL